VLSPRSISSPSTEFDIVLFFVGLANIAILFQATRILTVSHASAHAQAQSQYGKMWISALEPPSPV
jgi:hypothetical protein